MTSIEIGAQVPNNETALTPQNLRAFGQGIEGLGFDHLSIDDHVAIAAPERFGQNGDAAIRVRAEHELFTSLAYLAGVTSNLKFRSGVLVLPQRQTVLVARQAAEVDLLSDGRLTLGVGIGWNPLEFEALGESFSGRAKRFESQIDLLRNLWTNEFVTQRDEFHDLDRIGILPRPVQQPIPIWIGAIADVAIERAARIADGFMALGKIGQIVESQIATYVAARERFGRCNSSLPVEGWITLDDRDESRWKDEAGAWNQLGATHITLVTPPDPVVPIQDHLDLLAHAKSTIGGQLADIKAE